MAEITVDMRGHLPGADYPTAPAIAFDEEATSSLVEHLTALAESGYCVQVTVPTGSFEARIYQVGIVDDVYHIMVRRYDPDTEVEDPNDEWVSLLDLRRVLVH